MNRKPCKATGRVFARSSPSSSLAVCTVLIGCSSSADSKQQKAQAAGPRSVSVATAPVQRQDVPVYLSGLGAVTAFNTANIKSRVDGQIMKVNVREGAECERGRAAHRNRLRVPYQVQLDQMQAQLFRDQAQLRDAQLNLERYTALIPSGSIAQQQVDTQKASGRPARGHRAHRPGADRQREAATSFTATSPLRSTDASDSASRSGQHHSCVRYESDADLDPVAADRRDLHACRKTFCRPCRST